MALPSGPLKGGSVSSFEAAGIMSAAISPFCPAASALPPVHRLRCNRSRRSRRSRHCQTGPHSCKPQPHRRAGPPRRPAPGAWTRGETTCLFLHLTLQVATSWLTIPTRHPPTRCGGGRFASGPDAIMEEINASIGFRQETLWPRTSRGPSRMRPCLPARSSSRGRPRRDHCRSLTRSAARLKAAALNSHANLKTFNMNVEARLAVLIGPAAGRLHTARSRNDQWHSISASGSSANSAGSKPALTALLSAFLVRAEDHADTVMPGFTHLQPPSR